jgi:probable phosphoglycerate mutase
MDKIIYIVRHGQTDYNKQGIVQGSLIDASLNDFGRRQAEAFSRKYSDYQFDVVCTSELKRTHESVASFGVKAPRYEKLSGLNEISWGVFDGKSVVGDMNYWNVVDKWKDGAVHLKTEGGESPMDVASRQEPFIKWLKEEEFESALVCMHGRAMRILLCQLLDLPLVEMKNFKHDNLGVYKLKLNDTGFVLLEENNIEHLADLDPSE